VPPGADAVVQVEDTEKLPPGPDGQRRVRILKAAQPGLDIRQIGSDIRCDLCPGD
jgi:gephyrin